MRIQLSIIGICLIAFSTLTQAQKQANMERVKSQRVAYITNALALTSTESEKFWPIYMEFTQKEKQMRKEIAPDQPFDQMTEAEANALINKVLDSEVKVAEMKKSYYRDLLKYIPAVKLAKLDKAERDFKKELIKAIGKRKGK
ncbi:MAG TPA: hypothetical protein PLU58_13810 [Saprospiraceae bacterium]|jgi:hypothetical protein|nr:hypothetical protein [Saprospiraceae bacterium]